ncbi:MAG: 1-acyl-sn-glycerol-3-phosphate acyltransferase, partial [Betaproteobacteria bacterium]
MHELIRLFMRLLLRVRVLGDLAPFGHADRLLIVANHHSRLDAVMLALFLPRDPVVIVPTDDPSPLLVRWLLARVRHEILDLHNPLSMKRVLRLLRAGQPVVLFPEGRLVDNGAVMKI